MTNSATLRMRRNDPCPAAMRPYIQIILTTCCLYYRAFLCTSNLRICKCGAAPISFLFYGRRATHYRPRTLRPCLADYSEHPNLTLFVCVSVCAWNAMSEDVQLLGFEFIMSPNSKWHFEPYSLFAVTLIVGLLWEGLSFHEWSWHHLIQGRCPLW